MCGCIPPLRMWCASVAKTQMLPRVETEHRTGVWMRIASVYDGDTIVVAIVHDGHLRRRRCRLCGYDSPELRTRNEDERTQAVAARDHLATLLPVGRLFRGDVRGLDKYGRLLVDLRVRGCRVADRMIEAGHGYAYNGGTKGIVQANGRRAGTPA